MGVVEKVVLKLKCFRGVWLDLGKELHGDHLEVSCVRGVIAEDHVVLLGD